MSQLSHSMPDLLKELHLLEFDYAEGEGIDFEPWSEFLSEAETREWIRAWTGNNELDGAEYRVFGQDGTGGYAVIWCVRPDKGLLEQPIVFFGSEGEFGVVASTFADYLWLLAGGFGPNEAVEYADSNRIENRQFAAFAHEHAGASRCTPFEVLSKAKTEFPTFEENVISLCR